MMKTNYNELKGIYTFNNQPVSSYDFARNLGYMDGSSSVKFDEFTPYLESLVKKGILEKVYDFTENEYREALYKFQDDTEITIEGTDRTNQRLYYIN